MGTGDRRVGEKISERSGGIFDNTLLSRWQRALRPIRIAKSGQVGSICQKSDLVILVVRRAKKYMRIGKHMPTRRPTRNTLRHHFDLGRRRWTTIARDPRFRALLGPGDTPHALPGILTRLYELHQDPYRFDAYRRQLQGAARDQRLQHIAINSAST